MSAIATAVIGSAVIGGVVSSRNASSANRAAGDANARALAWEQEQYDDWKAIYGPLEQNLSEYYSNVTPEYYAAMGLENFQIEQQAMQTRLDESLAQRGLVGSGVEQSINAQNELSAAETRAGIRRAAPQQAAADKAGFLSVGMGNNPSAGMSNVLQQQANYANQQANSANQYAGQAVGNAVSTVGRGIADYIQSSSQPNYMAGSPNIDYTTGVA